MSELTLHGFKEFNKVLASLPDDTAKKVNISALRAATKPMLKAAIENVQADTGRLRDSLEIKTILKGEKSLVKVQANRKKGGYHAHLIELGTQAHDIKNVFIGGNFYPVVHHPGTNPEPFLRPAFESEKDEFKKLLIENLMKEVVKKFKKEMK